MRTKQTTYKELQRLARKHCKECKAETIEDSGKGYYENDCVLDYSKCKVRALCT